MALLDIIFLVFIGLFALVGFYKGLVDSILSLFGTLASLALAIFGGVRIANYVRTLIDLDGYMNSFLVDILKITQDKVTFLGMEIARTTIANYLGTILICILTFIVIRLTISTVGKILGSLTDSSKLLKSANRLLGLAFGALKGLLLVCCFFTVLTMVSFVEPLRVKFEPAIEETKIVSVVYEKTNEFVEDKLRDKLTTDYTQES